MDPSTFEKLGAFYLGSPYDLKKKERIDEPLLYDAKDLTTHAICVGMTGSGKTGLCISLIEEAVIDGIPALLIDPKGDLPNLLLTFPELRGEDFRPWINEDDARRKGKTPDDYARDQAELWKNGLADWGQDGARIRRLRDAARFDIFTPGSEAGLPVSILSSFQAPPEELRADGDAMRERVSSTATSLLGLMGLDADPIRSREHILLSTILDDRWRAGQDLDLATLIQAIQQPPVERVGVVDVDTFFPEKERFELAMQLNSLLAAPGFSAWLQGHPLDVQQLLYTAEGKPRVAILSIAHLSDSERIFFVSLLLNAVLAWMRTRPGTTSLRALLYMDEIFGFVPPTAEPPTKRPLLTLLKQARAYGLGVMLATQNPVDLDYKGLSNTGTWFLGRLQTERDKMRVLEGLEGAGAGAAFDRGEMEQTLAGLGKRVFLMHNVHEDAPVVFHTRWAMSYLRGPLTRQQIKKLTADRPAPTPVTAPASAAVTPKRETGGSPPVLKPSVPQAWIPARQAGDDLVYRPLLLGLGRVQYIDRKTKRVAHAEELALLAELGDGPGRPDWEAAPAVDLVPEELEREGLQPARYEPLAGDADDPRQYTGWKKGLADYLYRNRTCEVLHSPALKLTGEPGEEEGAFRIRLAELARERRDKQTEALRKKYARRMTTLDDRIRRAEMKVEREQEQAKGQRLQTAISVGTTLLSAFLGRKAVSRSTLGRATTAARGAARASKEKQDVAQARQDLAALQEQREELAQELQREIEQLEEQFDAQTEELERVALRPRRSDVEVRLLTLAWAPYRPGTGGLQPAWD